MKNRSYLYRDALLLATTIAECNNLDGKLERTFLCKKKEKIAWANLRESVRRGNYIGVTPPNCLSLIIPRSPAAWMAYYGRWISFTIMVARVGRCLIIPAMNIISLNEEKKNFLILFVSSRFFELEGLQIFIRYLWLNITRDVNFSLVYNFMNMGQTCK